MAHRTNFADFLVEVAKGAASPVQAIRDIAVSGNVGLTENVGKLLDRKGSSGSGGGSDPVAAAATGFAAGGPAGAAVGLLGSLFSGGGGPAPAPAPTSLAVQPPQQERSMTPYIIGGAAFLALLGVVVAVAMLRKPSKG
jgi:uncharacterized membrane protein YfcA